MTLSIILRSSQRNMETENLHIEMQADSKDLMTEVQELQETRNCPIKQNENLRDELALLMFQTQTYNENILEEIHGLQENVKKMCEKNRTLTAQAAHLQSLNEKKQVLIEHLRAALQSCLTNRDLLNVDNNNLVAEVFELDTAIKTN